MIAERKILEYLNNYRKGGHLKYKGVRVGFLGLPDFKYYKYQTLANSCHKLQRRGYIKKGKMSDYFITYKGVEFLEEEKGELIKFETNFNQSTPKTLLVIYDIPENKKKERDWFRYHLKKFHFILVQKSVWVGPAPLPKEFVDYVKEIKLGDSFKTFKLSKGYKQK